MQTLKMQELLFRNRKKDTIRLAGKTVNAQGPRGIRSLCRPGTAGDSPAKIFEFGINSGFDLSGSCGYRDAKRYLYLCKIYSSGSRLSGTLQWRPGYLGRSGSDRIFEFNPCFAVYDIGYV